MKSNDRKLKSKGIFNDYHEILKDYERERIIEKVPVDQVHKESGSEVQYLPHRAVVRQYRLTTKTAVQDL